MTLSRREFLKRASLFAAGTTLAACTQVAPAGTTPQEGGAGEAAPAAEQAPEAEAVTITYLIRTDIGAKMQEWTKESIDAFAEVHPEITVETIGVPWGDYNAKLLALYAAGTAPEVSANYAAGFPTFYANDALLPLDDYVASEGVDLSVIEQAALDSVTREGKLWALPLAHMPVIVFYNKALFDKFEVPLPPTASDDTSWTTDTMLDAAQRIAHDLDDPTAAEWGLNFGPGQLGVYSWLWGVDPFNDEGGPELTEAYQTGIITEAHYDRPEYIEFIQWLYDLVYTHQVSPRPSDTDAITQTVGWPMMSGRIGMFMQGAWSFTDFASVQPSWEWGIAPIPYGPAGVNTRPLFNDSWMLSSQAQNPEAGFTFLKFLGLEEGARLYAEIAGFFPAHKENYDIWFDSNLGIPNIAMNREQLEEVMIGSFAQGFPTPGKTLDRFPELNQAFNQTTAPIWNNEVGVEEGMAAVQEKFESVIASG